MSVCVSRVSLVLCVTGRESVDKAKAVRGFVTRLGAEPRDSKRSQRPRLSRWRNIRGECRGGSACSQTHSVWTCAVVSAPMESLMNRNGRPSFRLSDQCIEANKIMITKPEQSKKHAVFCLCFISLLGWRTALSCESRMTTRVASPEEIRAFFESKKMRVLTFLGYSGAEYEDKTAMLEHAAQILDKFDPRTTIVNIGATAEGIGAVYEAAKQKGFLTTGIVSMQAKEKRGRAVPLR